MTTIWTTETRPGFGWTYDQSGLTYDGQFDPLTNLAVFYDSLGTADAWTTVLKP